MITLRCYGLKTGDFQILNEWFITRRAAPFQENIVPPLGVVAEVEGEAVGATFAYQSAGIGVAFLDHTIIRPGTQLPMTRAIIETMLTGITACLRKDDYGLLRCFAESPAMERALKMFGFQGENRNLFLIL